MKAVNLCCSGFKLGEIELGPGRYEFELVPGACKLKLVPEACKLKLGPGGAVNLDWGPGA